MLVLVFEHGSFFRFSIFLWNVSVQLAVVAALNRGAVWNIFPFKLVVDPHRVDFACKRPRGRTLVLRDMM